MSKFQVGDNVCVLFAGQEIKFKIHDISVSPEGASYSSANGAWYSEDRLTYDLTVGQGHLIQKIDSLLHDYERSRKDLMQFMNMMVEEDLPPSLKERYFTKLGKLMGWP